MLTAKQLKAIARELNISKNTVKKIIRSNKTKFEVAKYTKGKPILGDHLELLKELLVENIKEPVKRRMTAKSYISNFRHQVILVVMNPSI